MSKFLGALGVTFGTAAIIACIPAGLEIVSGLVNPPKYVQPLGDHEYSPERLAECRSAARTNSGKAKLCEPDWPGGMPWSEYQQRQKLVSGQPNAQP